MASNMYRHPTSGEIFAYRTDAQGEIVAVAGPIPQKELDRAVNPITVCDDWLDNTSSADAQDDAAWLRREIERLSN